MCSYEDSRQAGCDPAIGGFVLSKITSRHGGRIGTPATPGYRIWKDFGRETRTTYLGATVLNTPHLSVREIGSLGGIHVYPQTWVLEASREGPMDEVRAEEDSDTRNIQNEASKRHY
jgi:hypothetical protein